MRLAIKNYPALNSDARTRRIRNHFVRDRWPIHFARQLTDRPSPARARLRADEPVRDPVTHGTRADEAQTLSAELTNNLVSSAQRTKLSSLASLTNEAGERVLLAWDLL